MGSLQCEGLKPCKLSGPILNGGSQGLQCEASQLVLMPVQLTFGQILKPSNVAPVRLRLHGNSTDATFQMKADLPPPPLQREG